MKAVVYTEYGSPDVLQLRQVNKPAPKDNEILVRIHASSVGYGDLLARNLRNNRSAFNMPFLFWLPTVMEFGYRTPKKQILGAEFAGVVEAAGKDVTRFSVGDPVFGFRGTSMGANAEYLCVPEDGLVASKPANMTYEEAATVPYGALTALNLLRKANIQPGQKVLINGASGAIGSAAVQLAKDAGAEVTGVCGTPRLAFVAALGADKVIDYTREDFTRNGETYDLIVDVLGKSSFSRVRDSLKPGGRYLLASFKGRELVQMLWTSMAGSRKVICALAGYTLEDLIRTKELVEAGKIRSMVDRCYPLEQTADAHRYIESGHRTGRVVITVAQN